MPDYRHPRPRLFSFWACKCPRCGRDKVFSNSIFSPTKFAKTREACTHCGLTYQPEPGFFFGAMYWSYAIIVATIVSMSIAFSVFGIFEHAIWAIPVVLILGLPLIFRYSRMLMLYVVYPVMYRDRFRKPSN
ncbi:MAG: DUF983 domain-containing protein [Bacteroidia bacterium]|nr:DUF983 domain-containing protein [Bacteroidia bacterium]